MAHPKTIEIYGAIGEGDNTPEAVSRNLKALGLRAGERGELRLNTPGGDCFMGNAIYNLLAGSGVKWTIHVDGVAASMGSLIATLPGAHVTIAENAFIMIHDPAAWAGGGSRDLTRTARLLDSIKDGMAKAYARRSGLPLATILKMMEDETWLNADEAVAKGFADEKSGAVKIAAGFNLAPFGYRKVPPVQQPATMAEAAIAYWAERGKAPRTVPSDPADLSDLVPNPATGRALTKAFHGRHAGRRG